MQKQFKINDRVYHIPEIKVTCVSEPRIAKSLLFKVRQSRDIFDLFTNLFDANTIDWREESQMICLSQNNTVVGHFKISTGGFAGTLMDPKVIFTIALNCGATNIILAHNHPSGNLQPSQADRTLTTKLVAAAKLLDMNILDHLILGDNSYFSFADEGILN